MAGPALAYWLHRHGMRVTVVEKAPAMRPGGLAVDFRGSAMVVLERMGILDELRRHATGSGDLTVVAEDGTAADHQVAFAAYERTLRGYVEGNHELGRQATASLQVAPTQELIDAIAAGPGDGETSDDDLPIADYQALRQDLTVR